MIQISTYLTFQLLFFFVHRATTDNDFDKFRHRVTGQNNSKVNFISMMTTTSNIKNSCMLYGDKHMLRSNKQYDINNKKAEGKTPKDY